MSNKQALKKIYFISLAVTVLIVLLAVIFRSSSSVQLRSPETELSEEWYTTIGQSEVLLETFPIRINTNVGEYYEIHKTVASTEDTLNLLIYTDHQDIVVRIGDDIVYIATEEVNSLSIYANLHHVISITNDTGMDQEVSITYHSPYARTSGLVMPIYQSYDGTGTLYGYIIYNHIWIASFGLLFILLGIVAFAISHVVDPTRSRGRFYLASFAIVFGLWIIAKSTLLQFITSNAYLLGGFSITMFMLLPIPLLLYYKGYVTTKYERFVLWMIAYYGLQAGIIICLQLFGVLDFYQPSLYVQVMMLLGMAIILVIVVLEVLSGNEHAKRFSRYYGILFLYGFITFINEQTVNQKDLAIYSLAVLTLLAVIIMLDYVFFIEKRLKLSYRSEDYAKLAYLDRLTGSKNRHAYEEDFERFFEDDRIKRNLRLVFFDFNGLKQINDQYGHVEGDFALKEGFTNILNAFGRYGECYRIGGDEFACIIQSLDDDLYASCRKNLINDIKSFSAYHKFNLGISIGTSTYHEGVDMDPNDMIVRADKNMYEDKQKLKEL